MESFFSNLQTNIQKAFKEVGGSPADKPKEPDVPKLTSSQVALSGGCLLGLGSVTPQSLACDAASELLALATEEGHVRVFGPHLDITLTHPAAPCSVSHLLFPRPGCLLAIGVSSAASMNGPPRTVAVYWELAPKRAPPSGPSAALAASAVLALRFHVRAVAVDREASVALLGTSEGDVRFLEFASGSSGSGDALRLASLCVPMEALAKGKDPVRPLPVSALAPSPTSSSELLLAHEGGSLLLWACDGHKVLRNYSAAATVLSIVWDSAGSLFLTASNIDVCLFDKSNSNNLHRIPLPGGPSEGVKILAWSTEQQLQQEGQGGTTTTLAAANTLAAAAAASSSQSAASKKLGTLLLWRGEPEAQVLSLSGDAWSHSESLFEGLAAGPVAAASLYLPEGSQGLESAASSGFQGTPCGCIVPPPEVSRDLFGGAQSSSENLLERLGTLPLLVGVTLSPRLRVHVRTLPPMKFMAWPVSWGSLEMTGVSAFASVAKGAAGTAILDLEGYMAHVVAGANLEDEGATQVLQQEAAENNQEAEQTEKKQPVQAEKQPEQHPAAAAAEEEASSPSQNLPESPNLQDQSQQPEGELEPPKLVQKVGIEEGELMPGVQPIPASREDLEAEFGHFLCAGEDGQGVRWTLASTTREVEANFSLSLSNKFSLKLFDSSQEWTLTFDAEEALFSWIGADSGGKELQSLVPGSEHSLVLRWPLDGAASLEVVWDDEWILGPLDLAPSDSLSFQITSEQDEFRLRSLKAQHLDASSPARPQKRSAAASAAAAYYSAMAESAAAAPAPAAAPTPSSSSASPPPSAPTSSTAPPPQGGKDQLHLLEAMFALRFGNFLKSGCGSLHSGESWRFLENWSAVVGGWQGVLCTGHCDGTVRLWLRAHTTVLLLQTVSVEAPQEASGAQSLPHYDGVDGGPLHTEGAVPPSPSAPSSSSTPSSAVTSVQFDLASTLLVVGLLDGRLLAFQWSGGEGPAAPPNASQRLPGGFIRRFGHQAHRGSAVETIRFAMLPATKGRPLAHCHRIVSVDVAGNLVLTDSRTGNVLWASSALSEGPASSPALAPTSPAADAAPSTTSASALSPAFASVSASAVASVACTSEILRLQKSEASPGAGSAPAASPPPPPTLPPTVSTGDLEKDEDVEAYVLALRSGELRQVTAADHRILDGRIQETRLPSLPPEGLLYFRRAPNCLVAVQQRMMFTLPCDSLGQVASSWSSKAFGVSALSAGLIPVSGTPYLAVLLESLFLDIFALPSLQTVASFDVSGSLGAAARGAAVAAGMAGVWGPQSSGWICPDGYLYLLSSGSTTIASRGLCAASILAANASADGSSSTLALAHLAQRLRSLEQEEAAAAAVGDGTSASAAQQQQETGGGSSGGKKFGLFRGLFARDKSSKTLRECLAQARGGDFDTNTIDQRRGLGPSHQDLLRPSATPGPVLASRQVPLRPPPPPPPPSGGGASLFGPPSRGAPPAASGASATQTAASSSARGASAALAEATNAAHERGDALSSLGAKTMKMSEDADQFLDLAKKLNAKQNRWF